MDDEKEEQPPFRWNPQAVFMLFFFMLAMTVPLMGVVWFARGYLSSRPAPPPAHEIKAKPTVDTKPLEEGLKRMSNEQFAATVTVEAKDGVELTVAANGMKPRLARILEIAKDAGGSGLEMSAPDAKDKRIVIEVAAARYDLLKRAIRGDRVDFSAIPAGSETKLLEVNLRAP